MKSNLSEGDNNLILIEVQALSVIHHPNIVNIVACENASYVKLSGKTKEVSIIVLELAEGGEFFDYVAAQPYSEAAACYYFK
jgi:serine/threonine protein kinase